MPDSVDYRRLAKEQRFLLQDFRFRNGQRLAALPMNCATWGTPCRDDLGRITNAVLLCHGTAGFWQRFTELWWSDYMFGPGQPLDIRRYYVVAPDHLGAGGSGKPSDGLRMAFPAYEHGDVVAAHHRLLTECLGITHLRLAIGTSYGGRLCWQWAVDHPQFLDGIVPLAATPYPLVGRRGMQDFLGIEPLLRDPTWNGGNYTEPPNNFPMALMGFWAWVFGSGHLWDRAPTREKAWTYLPHVVTKLAGELDANDWIYQLRVNDTYDLRDRLARIQARVLFLEMAGDEIVPRELGATEQVLATLGDRAEHLRVAEAEHYGHAGVAKTLPLYAPRIAAFLKSLEPQPGT